jgi:hypothetical protein
MRRADTGEKWNEVTGMTYYNTTQHNLLIISTQRNNLNKHALICDNQNALLSFLSCTVRFV